MTRARPLCAEESRAAAEPLGATASRIDNWLLVEYRGAWGRDVIGESLLSGPVKAHLRAQLAALPNSRLLFIRRPERRAHARRAVFFGRSEESTQRFYQLEIEDQADLLSLDVAAALDRGGDGLPGVPLTRPLLVVCTHGKRDRCCARYGRPLYEALRQEVDPDWVWQSSHVGGDRFAGNVVCLPLGLYFGRVERTDVRPLVARLLDGEILLDRYRGRSCYPFPVQAAERTVRAEAALTALDGLRLAGAERRREGVWRVRFEAGDGDVHEVEVETDAGEPAYLTCGAVAPQRPRRFVTLSYRVTARRR